MSWSRFLSIQSHVVAGYCGNKAAIFPLQVLGCEVDFINTVQFSNHTQYPTTEGYTSSKEDFDKLYHGLKANSITQLYSNIISGYISSANVIESMTNAIVEIKNLRTEHKFKCTYTLDPVLGDDGVGFYVPEENLIIQAYQNLISLADIVVPNRFEASKLSSISIDSIQTAQKAIEYFHDKGVTLVVLTSFQIDPNKKILTCLASYKYQPSSTSEFLPEKRQFYRIDVPKLDCPFTGTGDLFAALLTGWLYKTNYDIKLSFEKTISSMQQVLSETYAWSRCVQGQIPSPLCNELRLIQNKNVLEKADLTFISTSVNV